MPPLQRVLAEILKDPGSPDPVVGYACLYGGYDHKNRAAPGKDPWFRPRGYGPAFFTKFLYFLFRPPQDMNEERDAAD